MSESDLPIPRGRPRKLQTTYQGKMPLEVDFTLDPAELILPAPESLQSRALGWTVAATRLVNRTQGLYEKLPMLCRGANCFWASQCPTAPSGFLFEGLRCPLEVMEVWRTFCRYIVELEVHPDDHVDVNLVTDLVRIDLQVTRIDQQLMIDGLLVDTVAGIAQKESKPVYEKGVHPLVILQRGLREDRDKIYKRLVASRDAKRAQEAREGKQQTDVLTWMTRLRQAAEKGNLQNFIPATTLEGTLPALPPPELEDDEAFDPFGGVEGEG